MSTRTKSCVVLFALLLAACGGGMSGKYEQEGGLGSLEFEQNGRVYVSILGATFAGEYELDGERVVIEGPNGSQVLKRNGERLEGGFGLVYVRK